jgi:hypothetical protein
MARNVTQGRRAKMIHRGLADGIRPKRAVDEAITRIKAILGEQVRGHAALGPLALQREASADTSATVTELLQKTATCSGIQSS